MILHDFDYERPQQSLLIFTPEQGLSHPVSIFSEDKDPVLNT